MNELDLYDYELPRELIAQEPLATRSDARLMLVNRANGQIDHYHVRDLPEILSSGDVLVLNNSRVIPARLTGRKSGTGGKVELLLVERIGEATLVVGGVEVGAERWTALGRATGRLRPGLDVIIGGQLSARVVDRDPSDGTLHVLLYATGGGDVAELIEQVGAMPLPPYLGRPAEPADRQRYQTVFARAPGAVAAPTAGLHFSERLLRRLDERGVRRTAITLHVGPGTFRPVAVDDLEQHPMHSERFVVAEDTAREIRRARQRNRPVVAIGTTVVRALETAADPGQPGCVRVGAGTTRLLIQPGYRFQVVDGLLTNFHLPGSTLLALVYAFRGAEPVREAYEEAIRQRYRFYSYGDAMYLPPGGEPRRATAATAS